ncbi:MAG: cell envelope integrity protein CreD [Chitinophagaceae bacterium]|nr:cell envelope integrity protein CreD [Chitinophagaceae bacterium]
MKNKYTALSIAARIWSLTSAVFGIGCIIVAIFSGGAGFAFVGIIAGFAAAVASLPVGIALYFFLPSIQKSTTPSKLIVLILFCLGFAFAYALLGSAITVGFNLYSHPSPSFFETLGITTAILTCCSLIAILISYKAINYYFFAIPLPSSNENWQYNSETQTNTTNMETTTDQQQQPIQSWENNQPQSQTNKTLIKAIITAVLILAMLIPTMFVSNLITEREQRQKEVVKEVTSKWASQQTITTPYIYIPYTSQETGSDGKPAVFTRHLLLLPENLAVYSKVLPEERPRSIYKVLLYKTNIDASGDIVIQLPKDINQETLQLADAKICMGLTDFKGIEERVMVTLDDNLTYELTPGLPTTDIDSVGLSSPIKLTAESLGKSISFKVKLKIKGSEKLYFAPLAGNSSFTMQSIWASPSFDGNVLPSERKVNDSGFTAKWTFNKASLPFGTTLKNFNFNKNSFAFGVSMLQPADQYAKTTRSVKYAILIIGLTFALFFIIELMQKKALHPVQYILVGIALIIFYTLLLSISEFILFDYAYLIAATATVLLIMLYAKSHFENWKTASIFGGIFSDLYAFILIKLEDTALLVGSIGLFIVLALVMYASRKINWYNPSFNKKIEA